MMRPMLRNRFRFVVIGVLILLGCSWMLFHAERVSALSEDTLHAPSAILMEPTTGQVLFAKNADEQRACASITKVMTLLLTMEALEDGKISLTEMATTSAHAASMGGSDIWLEAGETMSVDDLLKATVIMSANDAAVVLAELISGSEEAFVERMNQRASELGMTNTTFKNCNGLDEEGHLTTARDVALMTAELMRHPMIFNYTTIWMDSVRGGETQLVNTNKLLKTYSGITGMKTGTTGAAGSCITATAERNELSLVAVVLGCDTTQDRFQDAAALLDYGFANWSMITPEVPELPTVTVKKGLTDSVAVEVSLPDSVLVEKGTSLQKEPELTLTESVEAPVQKGQALGKIRYYTDDGTLLVEGDVCAAETVEPLTILTCFGRLWTALCSF